MRGLEVAGGSQLGEQQCLCLLVSLLPSVRFVALRPSRTLQTTTPFRVQYSVPGDHGTPGVDGLH